MKRVIIKGILNALATFTSVFFISLQGAVSIDRASLLAALGAASAATFSSISQYIDKGVANATKDVSYR